MLNFQQKHSRNLARRINGVTCAAIIIFLFCFSCGYDKICQEKNKEHSAERTFFSLIVFEKTGNYLNFTYRF